MAQVNILFPDDEDSDNKSTGSNAGAFAFDHFINSLADNIDPNADKSALMWHPLKGPQTMAFETLANETFYGGAAGGGKLVTNSTPILTPFGWKNAEDVKVGDSLIAMNGQHTKVLGVYPHKNMEVYRVTFIDGAQVDVGADHLWYYWEAGDSFKGRKRFTKDREYILYSPPKGFHIETVKGKMAKTSDLYKYHKKQEDSVIKKKRPYWIETPLCEPIKFTRPTNTRQGKVIRINPYVLGLLIGDGSITNDSISITNIDEYIIDYLRDLYESDFRFDGKKNIRVIGDARKELVKQLKSYNLLGTTSLSKFIPDQYLFASIETRFELMAGLIDTDGYIDTRGHVSYTTISERLAGDIQHLARSLGLKATIKKGPAGYKDSDGNYIECNDAYTVYMMGQYLDRCVKLPRKKSRLLPYNGGNSECGRRITSIEKIENTDGVCFSIDVYGGLHVIKDFIVTHNSDLLLGWALTRAVKSIIFRREYPQLKQIIDRSHAMLDAGKIARYNGQQYVWTNIPGGRTLEFGSVPHEDSVTKYMGRPHDFIGFDEVSNFTLLQYIFLSAWNRTEIKGIRTRIISAGNPPTNVEGEWVIRRWAPWLDPQYGNPAAPGELRWFAQLGDKEEEVESGEPIKISRKVTGRDDDEVIYPTSRTFIPASVDDNPHYGQDYKARLQSLPIELREKFLYGNFGIVFKDDPWQVIPSAWVKDGRERYNEMMERDKVRELENVNPAFGVDPAEAGKDNSTIAKITINVVQYVKYNPQADTMKIADWIVATMIGARGATIAIDSIGVGAGVHYRLKQLGFQSLGIKASSKTNLRDRTGNMQFLNLRAYLWWMLRDALDPNGGVKLAIPPDIKLERELITPRWELTDSGLVQVEKQESIRQRLGRSPDAANAVMLALFVSRARRPALRMV